MATPRLLLFGTPGAGKSALLGALASAAPGVHAEVVDVKGELDALQKKTYQDKHVPTKNVETFDLRVKSDGPSAWAHHRMMVVDCPGLAALDMLKAEEPFANSHPMQRPILDSDAIVLAVDVSASGKELVEQFQQFGNWLHELHEVRGQRADVADLPVYLVLTKCDLLAKKEYTFAKWMQAIEEAKNKVDEKFREYLKEQGPGFGTVKLHLWATAIRRPLLADRQAETQSPFGVAELFRESLASASEFQERRASSQSRLQNVIAGLVGLIAVLGLLVAFLYEFQPVKRVTLDEKAHEALPRAEANVVERLQGSLKTVAARKAKLNDVIDHPDFERLPTSTQQDVAKYHEELTGYIRLYEEAQVVLRLPHLAKNEKEFDELEKNVKEFVAPKEWDATVVGKRADRCVKEFAAVRAAAKAEESWLSEQIKTNNALFDRSDGLYKKVRDKAPTSDADVQAWKALKAEFDTQIQRRPAVSRQEIISGVTRVKHEDLGMFAAVKDARSEWQRSKDTLLERSDYIQDRLKKK